MTKHWTFVRQLISLPAVALLFVCPADVGAIAQEDPSNSSVLPLVWGVENAGEAYAAPTFQGCTTKPDLTIHIN